MLIDSLMDLRQKRGHDITVVFDGWKTGEGKQVESVIGGIRVIYSRIGERADDVIKRIISSERRQWIVVSSDRDVAAYAWASGSIPAPSEEFLRAMMRWEKPCSDSGEDEDEDVRPHRKGNPRQRSRREKAVSRALRRL